MIPIIYIGAIMGAIVVGSSIEPEITVTKCDDLYQYMKLMACITFLSAEYVGNVIFVSPGLALTLFFFTPIYLVALIIVMVMFGSFNDAIPLSFFSAGLNGILFAVFAFYVL